VYVTNLETKRQNSRAW